MGQERLRYLFVHLDNGLVTPSTTATWQCLHHHVNRTASGCETKTAYRLPRNVTYWLWISCNPKLAGQGLDLCRVPCRFFFLSLKSF